MILLQIEIYHKDMLFCYATARSIMDVAAYKLNKGEFEA